jgi:hypothetical protein
MLIGTDLLKTLGIIIDFKSQQIHWDDASMPFKNRDAIVDTTSMNVHDEDIPAVTESMKHIKHILDAKYEMANLLEIANTCTNLTSLE